MEPALARKFLYFIAAIILLILAALALWQNWDRVERWIDPPQARNASGEVVLYATQWCGYCAKTRELFAEDGFAGSTREIARRLGVTQALILLVETLVQADPG